MLKDIERVGTMPLIELLIASYCGKNKPRLTSKIGDLPSQFDALVSEELRDACKAATEAWAGENIINKT